MPPCVLEYCKYEETMPPGEREYRKYAEMMALSDPPGPLVAKACLEAKIFGLGRTVLKRRFEDQDLLQIFPARQLGWLRSRDAASKSAGAPSKCSDDASRCAGVP